MKLLNALPPLSKVLMENSIDAGASKIDVEIMAGGTSFIRITDNGRAMTREDVQALPFFGMQMK